MNTLRKPNLIHGTATIALMGEAMAFTPICRKSVRPPEATKKLQESGMAAVESENRLEVRNQGDHAEIVLIGRVGGSWWDEAGITEKEFRDALKAVPKGKLIKVSVNSEGGSVKEGLGIYNAIKERASDIQVRIAGYALSIASVFPLAAKKSLGGRGVVSPKSAIWMQHKAWSWAQGNADEMRQAAEMLDAHDETLAEIYSQATGKTKDEVLALMKNETWTKGSAAVDAGLADETDEADDANASYRPLQPDFIARCKNLSGDILNTVRPPENRPISAPKQGADAENENDMKREQKFALLAQWGIQLAKEAQDAMTDARLDELVNMGKTAAIAALAQSTTTPQPAAKGGTDTEARLAAIEAKYKAEKEARVKSELDQLVKANKITRAQADKALPQIMAEGGEAVLALLKENPEMPQPAEDVGAGVEITSDSISDIDKGAKALRAPINAMLKGEDVDPKIIHANALKMAGMIAKNEAKLRGAFAANTISADLQRNVILATGMRAFKRRVIMLGIFSTRFNSVPLLGTNKVVVPYYPLDTEASKDFVDGTGYQFDQGSNTLDREVTINVRKYKPFNFYSHQLARQPFFDVARLMELKAEQLGVDVVSNVCSIITAANFGAAVKTEAAETFDSDDVVDIGGACDEDEWPEVGRSLALSTAYHTNLKKDPALKSAERSGSTSTLREGSTGRVDRFDIFQSPRIPANGENLKGFACLPSALLVATSPIAPGPGVRKQLISYDVVIDPDTGLAFEYRYWGSADQDEEREVVECNFGKDVGEADALKRITSA